MKPHIDRANMVMVTIKVNKSHKFAINVRGEPPPTLTWFDKDGNEIKPSDRIKVRDDDDARGAVAVRSGAAPFARRSLLERNEVILRLYKTEIFH